MPNNNLLFAQVMLPVLDKPEATRQILSIPDEFSFWDNYRHTKMIPLMTKGNGATNFIDGEFKWTSYAPSIIKDWFDQTVFPWMGMQSRVMALVTQPGVANYEHIDCDPHELNTKQHKFRIVLQGRTDTLYFITTDGNKFAPNISVPFIMDGGWPHGMENSTTEVKVTLAVGAPWVGNTEYKNTSTMMERSNYSMPHDLSAYWKKTT